MNVLRIAENVLPDALLNDSPALHNCDKIRDLPHQAEIMRYQQVGQAMGSPKI